MVEGFLITKDIAVLLIPIATIILGLIIGWLCQRSGFCSIGGAPAVNVASVIIPMIISGIAVGLIGTFLGGCPLRQLVMTSEGKPKIPRLRRRHVDWCSILHRAPLPVDY